MSVIHNNNQHYKKDSIIKNMLSPFNRKSIQIQGTPKDLTPSHYKKKVGASHKKSQMSYGHSISNSPK